MMSALAGIITAVMLMVHCAPVLAQAASGNPAVQSMPENCACRAAGTLWQVGAAVCLNGRTHICAMQQNVLSWQDTCRACPLADEIMSQRVAIPRTAKPKV